MRFVGVRICGGAVSLDERGLSRTDYYLDGDRVVFTSYYHLKRGHCCGSGCRHCPYDDAGRPKPDILARFPELAGTFDRAGGTG